MAQFQSSHTHRFSIADGDAVGVLLRKLGTRNGSHSVDGKAFERAELCVTTM